MRLNPVPAPADHYRDYRNAGTGGVSSVLLAEHEPAVAGMLARYLARDGLEVDLAATGDLALLGLADGVHSVAVLDLTMPGLDPRRVRRALRTPVVFLAAPGPRPRGLNGSGPDGSGPNGNAVNGGAARRWLTRPFGPRLLVATVRELLCDAAQSSVAPQAAIPATTTLGGLRLDGRRRLAVLGGRDVPLTRTEFGILAALLAAPGRALSRRQLLTAAGRKADDRAVDVYIAQLRAKIGVPGLIRTIRGAGYAVDERGPELGGGPNLRGQ